jgi:hypothetical protein
MSQRIIQIIPSPPEHRSVYYNPERGDIVVVHLTCLALVEKGSNQSVVYMETVDKEVKEADTDDPNFMGFCSADDTLYLTELSNLAAERYKKERNVKSK